MEDQGRDDDPNVASESVADDQVDELSEGEGSDNYDEYGLTDPVAEGEDPVSPKPEPSYKKANSVKFFTICSKLERIQQNYASKKKNKKKWSDEQKLHMILPPKFLASLDTPSDGSDKPESIFPILRLLIPEKDGSRYFGIKEKLFAQVYTGALELSKTSARSRMLNNFTDPNIVPSHYGAVGVFSDVVHCVVGETKIQHKDRGSDYTIGQINKYLDELAALSNKTQEAKSKHDFKNNSGSKKKKKGSTLMDLRIAWLRKINEGTSKCAGLSPLEHKWLVRIVTEQMKIGLGWEKILRWYNPYAAMLWSAHSSLKGICDKLCQPEFAAARAISASGQKGAGDSEEEGLSSYMPKSLVSLEFGKIFSPMLSERTGFDRLLDSLSHRHREFIASEKAKGESCHVHPDSLAFKHPAFTVEPKLDGERFLVHIGRNGVVKMHTRKGNWYSELYSPVLGPAFRRAVGKWDFDVILDGEVLAWDDGRKETIAFGSNRTVAKLRKAWMERRGMLDPRDSGMHDEDRDVKSMNAANTWFDKVDLNNELAGEECWLLFAAFDVLYVGGPGAAQFLSDIVSPHISPRPAAGSIINLDGFERKKILYKLIEPQEKQVEIVQTWIVRPNGSNAQAEEYFDPQNPLEEGGYPDYMLDSLSCIVANAVPELSRIDVERRRGLSDEQISQARACAVQELYDCKVEQQRLEGLVFKDLSAPYYLGEESRSLKYWYKFKPDYFNGSVASDLDVVIIGSYFATGLRNQGRPSSFLCACVDSDDRHRFLPLCKVNMGSMDYETSGKLLKATGFSGSDDEGGNQGRDKWFRSDEVPDFVSQKSFQAENEGKGWRFVKKDYPDLWIDPDDSHVLTLNAGEIVPSETFSVGLTLRFPRITKLREGADGKSAEEIENERYLWEIYQRVVAESRSNAKVKEPFLPGSPSSIRDRPCRFLTEEQYAVAKKTKKKARPSQRKLGVFVPAKVSQLDSAALKEVSFTVLDGKYKLEEGSMDMAEAKEQGFFEQVQLVRTADAVKKFIMKHGGTSRITADGQSSLVLGGTRTDARVVAHIQAIENARSQVDGKKAATKRALEQKMIARDPGVLRWIYVYSLVHRWRCMNPESSDRSIKETNPELLQPTVLDYLARPSNQGVGENLEPDLLEVDLSHVSAMRRAIYLVSQSKRARRETSADAHIQENQDRRSWRDECIDRLAADERWVGAGQCQVLWPYMKQNDNIEERHHITLYPDVFGDDFGSLSEGQFSHESTRNRWNSISTDVSSSRIASALPLARIMGAFVTPHLHQGVTHILCDLKEGHDEITVEERVSPSIFADPSRGRQILARLDCMGSGRKASGYAGYVILVTPNWLRKRKWRGIGASK